MVSRNRPHGVELTYGLRICGAFRRGSNPDTLLIRSKITDAQLSTIVDLACSSHALAMTNSGRIRARP